jgi:hypothetical protein
MIAAPRNPGEGTIRCDVALWRRRELRKRKDLAKCLGMEQINALA